MWSPELSNAIKVVEIAAIPEANVSASSPSSIAVSFCATASEFTDERRA